MSPFPNLVEAECRRAAELHPPLANHDEAISVLDEEVHEVQQEVHKKGHLRADAALLEELVQTAAVAKRWVETTGLYVVLGTPFDHAVELTLAIHRRELKPAAGDHESLTRLKRIMSRVWNYSINHGHTLAACQHDMSLALVVVAATCRRWAEDRGLCPVATVAHDGREGGGRVTVLETPGPAKQDSPPASEEHAAQEADQACGPDPA